MKQDAFFAILRHDIEMNQAAGAQGLVACFFLLTLAFISFALHIALGVESALLQKMAPASIWLCFLLAAVISLEHIFIRDEEEGVLDQLMLSALSLEGIVLAKACAHCISFLIPLLGLAVFTAILLNLAAGDIMWLVLALFCGAPAMSLLGTLASLLCLGLKRPAMLIGLLCLPFYLPLLLFGAMAMEKVSAVLILAGFSLAWGLLAPVIGAFILRERE